MSGDFWIPHFNRLSPAYEIFSWLPEQFLSRDDWPDLNDYNSLLSHLKKPACNDLEKPILFVSQAAKSTDFSAGYEPRIYLSGEVQTRKKNWHDFFNTLIWCTFPNIKSKLNSLQYRELLKKRDRSKQRSYLENFLTLFDENGLIIISSNLHLLNLIKTMQWKEFFWQQRTILTEQLRCFVFGHSLHEKLLHPYVGMVGHSILMHVSADFFIQSWTTQIETIAKKICNLDLSTMTTNNLFPIPILGFPDWYYETTYASFYDNQDYFRIKNFKP